MTTDKLRAKFEAWYVENAFDYPSNPIGSRECGLQWKAYQAAHASRDAEVEALKKCVGNVVRQMKDCASDISQTPSLTGQWVADTINWFADEIGIGAVMREKE